MMEYCNMKAFFVIVAMYAILVSFSLSSKLSANESTNLRKGLLKHLHGAALDLNLKEFSHFENPKGAKSFSHKDIESTETSHSIQQNIISTITAHENTNADHNKKLFLNDRHHLNRKRNRSSRRVTSRNIEDSENHRLGDYRKVTIEYKNKRQSDPRRDTRYTRQTENKHLHKRHLLNKIKEQIRGEDM